MQHTRFTIHKFVNALYILQSFTSAFWVLWTMSLIVMIMTKCMSNITFIALGIRNPIFGSLAIALNIKR